MPWEGIADVVDGLAVGPGDTVLDLGCGRGGYGMEVARRSGAGLIGVDFSAIAIAQARSRIAGFGLETRAEFRVGDLTATGLPDGSVQAVMCIDAIQFADPPSAALLECRRVLEPGGRLVVTWWEARDRDEQAIPERVRRLDLHDELVAAGFAGIQIDERPDWQAIERELWQTAASAPSADDDRGLRALQDEASRVAPIHTSLRRLFGRATT